jgi:hypothetical protein
MQCVFLLCRKCSPPSGCGVRSTSTTSSCPLPSTAPGPRGTLTSTTAPGKRRVGSEERASLHNPRRLTSPSVHLLIPTKGGPTWRCPVPPVAAAASPATTQHKIPKKNKPTWSPLVRLDVVQFHRTCSSFPPAFCSGPGPLASLFWIGSPRCSIPQDLHTCLAVALILPSAVANAKASCRPCYFWLGVSPALRLHCQEGYSIQ